MSPLPLPVPLSPTDAAERGYVSLTTPYDSGQKGERAMLISAWQTLKGTNSIPVSAGGSRFIELYRHRSEIKRSFQYN